MKKEFLKSLGLEDEKIEKIMLEHDKSLQSTQSKLITTEENMKTLQEQLTQRDKDMKELKKQVGDNEELTNKLTDLQDKYKSETESLTKKINEIEMNASLEIALIESKARNTKAVKALLDLDQLSLQDGKLIGLDEQLKKVKEQNNFMFGNEKIDTNYSPNKGGGLDVGDTFESAMKSEGFNLTQYLKQQGEDK